MREHLNSVVTKYYRTELWGVTKVKLIALTAHIKEEGKLNMYDPSIAYFFSFSRNYKKNSRLSPK